nr:hypothetical protein [Tanacetum cinerariifolium]
MRRVGKGFSGVETPLCASVNAAIEEAVQEQSIPSPTPPPQPSHDLPGNKVKVLKLRRLKKVGTSQRIDTLDDTIMEDVSNHGRMIDELDKDEGVSLTAKKEEERKTEEAKNNEGAALMSEKEEEKNVEKVKDITSDAQVKG